MGLFEQAAALERRYKNQLKPENVQFVVFISPCYECDGCEKCEEYHKVMNEPHEGRTIIVDDVPDEDC